MIYKLTKLSDKGFTFKSKDIQQVYNLLRSYVCKSCMLTKDEIIAYAQDNNLDEDEVEYMMYNAFPDNFKELPCEDKVDWLMGTPCGMEFALEQYPSEIEDRCYKAIHHQQKVVTVRRSLFEEYLRSGGKVSELPNYVTHLHRKVGDQNYTVICLY